MRATKIIVSMLSALCLIGCVSTDLVSVDKKSAKATGIEITSFEDNPFFAHIHYDFSKIQNFDEKKVSVYLSRSSSLYPPSNFEAEYINRVLAEDDANWRLMSLSSFANALPEFRLKKKDVTILHREPGYIKILAIDDIGKYVVTYNN